MEDQAQAENIADWIILGLHILDVDDFRSHVAWSTAPDKKIFLGITELRKTEVGNDQVAAARLSEDQIFWFKITMHSLLSVHFFEAVEDRKHYFFDFVGLEFFFCFDLIMKKSSFQ